MCLFESAGIAFVTVAVLMALITLIVKRCS